MADIYLRPLEINDALTSYKWRNDPVIWEFTGSRPDRTISPEMEIEWIKDVLQRQNEVRYAICIGGSDEYIGNVQLTNISNNSAELHIFIGETKYWGKKFGSMATTGMVDIGFNRLGLKEIYLFVNKKNITAIKAYLNSGFIIESCDDFEIKMVAHDAK
jgi:diamine N-acetyltransferase